MIKKYIFITGGVLSSLGKGLTCAAIGNILEAKGISISFLKLDPYLNVDPGTMNPFEHGEVYVTDDGAETDLDLGHYYRYTKNPLLSKFSNTTSGQIYDSVIKQERKGDFLGNTVQVIPHITDEIKKRISLCSNKNKKAQILFVEIGGTVGDIESLPFLEAIRQFRNEKAKDCINIHLTYVPFLKSSDEIKTKPTQHSVQVLRGIGIIPDIILCRCEKPLTPQIKAKIALFCNVKKENVLDEPDVTKTIYEVPLQLHTQKIDKMICNLLDITNKKTANLKNWKELIKKINNPKKKIKIAIIGKYLHHQDAYKSIFEALNHASIYFSIELELKKIDSDKLTSKNINGLLKGCSAILIPGGFGIRGIEGKILAAKYSREKKIPYFGICLGLQVLIIEFARNVLNFKNANSTEFDQSTPYPVVDILKDQKKILNLGGTMRLGAFKSKILKTSLAYKAYKKIIISERHRHRYEINNKYTSKMEEKGLLFSGILDNGNLFEIAEMKNHPWMLGVQFHPEFKSKPLAPHPLFKAFIQAIIKKEK